MKKTTILFFLNLFFISSFSGFSQITLYSENFDTGNTINGTYLNDSGVTSVALCNAHSITGDDLYLFNDPDIEEYCDSDEDWKVTGTAESYFGTAPDGMASNRAGILQTGSYCYRKQWLITPTWTASRSIMTITFSYSYRGSLNEGFYVYLQSRSGTDSFANIQTLVSKTNYNDASC